MTGLSLRNVGSLRLKRVEYDCDRENKHDTTLVYHLVLKESLRTLYWHSQEAWWFERSLTRAMRLFRHGKIWEYEMPLVARFTDQDALPDQKLFEDDSIFPEPLLCALRWYAQQFVPGEVLILSPVEALVGEGDQREWRPTSAVEIVYHKDGQVEDATRFTLSVVDKLNRRMQKVRQLLPL